MISFKDLQFSYSNSNFSFKVASFSIAQGEKVALIGPSGYGKTTLLKIIAGIFNFQAKAFDLFDINWKEASVNEKRNFRKKDIGIVFQDFKLLPYLNVMDNVLLNSYLAAKEDVFELLKRLQLETKIKSYPNNLSQGEQQRVAIARALIKKPKLILADEPTGNLDPESKLLVKNLIFDVCNESNATLIFITHDMDLTTGFDQVINCKDLIEYV